MTKRKLLFFLLLATLLLLSGGILYYFYQLNKNSKLYEYIPADADVVIFINTQNLIKKQLFEKKDTGLFNTFKTKLEEMPYFKDVKSTDELGIDVFSGMAMVESKNIKYCLLKLKDDDQFTAYLDKKKALFKAVKTDKGTHLYITHDKLFYVGYNSDFLAVMVNDERLKETDFFNLLTVKINKSFAVSPNFTSSKNDSAFAWFYDNKKILSPTKVNKGYVILNKGFTVFASDLAADMSKFPTHTDTLYKHSSYVFVGNNKPFQPILYKQIGKFSSFFDLARYDDSYANFDFESSKYLMVFDGPAITDKVSMRYEFDENFNKHLVTTTTKDTIESCIMYYTDKVRDGFFTNHPKYYSNTFRWPDPSYDLIISIDEKVFKDIVPMPVKFRLNAWSKKTFGIGYCYINVQLGGFNGLKF
jgi:hypothetical protein